MRSVAEERDDEHTRMTVLITIQECVTEEGRRTADLHQLRPVAGGIARKVGLAALLLDLWGEA
jgi:protein-disulfide isomerase-like protein with CxxC motif